VLNKEVCKKCVLHFSSIVPVLWPMSWDDGNERLWETAKLVICPYADNKEAPMAGVISIFAVPPKQCPYALEHIVSQDENAE